MNDWSGAKGRKNGILQLQRIAVVTPKGKMSGLEIEIALQFGKCAKVFVEIPQIQTKRKKDIEVKTLGISKFKNLY